MLNEQVFQFIRCCVTKSPLHQATPEQLLQINQRIADGQLRDRLGRTRDVPISGALLNEDRSLAYPVTDAIPTLIADEAIVLDDTFA